MIRPNARVQLLERLLVVFLLGGFLAGQARGAELGGVADDLHLAGERELVGRQAEREKDVRVERLLLGVGLGGVEPLVELAEHLLHLAEQGVIHDAHPTPSCTLRRVIVPPSPGPNFASATQKNQHEALRGPTRLDALE